MPGSAQVNANLTAWEIGTKGLCKAEMGRYATKMEAWAQSNRRWEDQTDDARGGLEGNLNAGDTKIEAIIAHTVEHGIYLELRDFSQKGRLDILEKAVQSDLSGLISRLRAIVGSGFGGVSFGGGSSYGPF